MPSRAKLTTRGISTTTVTTDSLPKNLPLTNNELDSNFLNLRDQSFSIVGDDSTGIDIKAGDTIKFTGSGGATVTAVGDTVTITAGGGGSSSLGDLSVSGTTISSVTTNSNIILDPNGTGKVVIGDFFSTGYITSNGSQALILQTNSGTNSGSININYGTGPSGGPGTSGNGNIEISTSGVGQTHILASTTQVGRSNTDATITTNGTGDLILNTNSGTNSGTITIADGTNGNIIITPNGTGITEISSAVKTSIIGGTTGLTLAADVTDNATGGSSRIVLGSASTDNAIRIQPNAGAGSQAGIEIYDPGKTTADIFFKGSNGSGKWIFESGNVFEIRTNNGVNANNVISFGGSRANEVELSTNSAKNLLLTTNLNSNSGTITIEDGVNGNIAITPNGTGSVVLDGLSYPQSDGSNGQVLTTNGAGILSWTTATAQGITFVGDDSTGTRISDGETIKIAGAGGITTAMSGDTLTISGSQGITIVGDDSTGTRVSDNETFKIAGAGSVSTAVSGDTLTITGTDTNTTYSISAETATGGANLRLTDSGATTDDVKIASGTGITVSRTDANTITVATSGTYLTDIVNDTTPQLGGDLDVQTYKLISTSNGNIELAPNGTGDVYLTADTVRVGDSNADATITTNGTGDLILNTNSGSSSGVIKIADGSAGKISIIPNTTGRVDLGHETETTTNFPTAIGSLGGFEVTDARIRGTGRFYSNLTYAPYTATTDQLIAGNTYAMVKTNGGSFDSANIRNVASANQMVFDLNGGSATATTTNVTSTGVGSQVNTNYYMNTAGGTKTGLNSVTNRNFTQIVAGHGGSLTIPRTVGVLNDFTVARNTGDTTTLTEMWGFRDQGITYSGTGTTGTNSIVTDYTAFEAGVNAPSSTNTPWAFRVRTASQNWRSSIGAVDLPKRWSTTTTHAASGAYTVDYQSSGNGFRQVTLGGNITSFTMSNFPTSTNQISEFDIVFIQDGTGGRTISFTPTSTEVFKFRNGTSSLSDSTAAPEVLHAKVFVRYDGTKSIYYWDIDNREYV